MTDPRTVEAMAAQLRDELGAVASGLSPLVPMHVGRALEDAIDQCAPMLAAQLASDDDRLAAETVIDVMRALHPGGCDPPPEWWHTPVGRACARSLGRDDAESVTQSVAAAMLGVTRGTVAQLVHRGTLDRHPDGGVLRASVMQRLAR